MSHFSKNTCGWSVVSGFGGGFRLEINIIAGDEPSGSMPIPCRSNIRPQNVAHRIIFFTVRRSRQARAGSAGGVLFMNRALEVMIAGILIVFTCPLMIVVALAIKLDSPGPVLSRINALGHSRANRADILKFRTTVYEPEILGRSPRRTRVGQFLYLTRIDDLPQLFNILRGDLSLMSLSGA
ncbi:MAG: sugar transferase [Alphaproteobacteria bacterium]